MAEPRIQYAKTEDGVSIAYATTGQGPPFVAAPEPPVSHIQLDWQRPRIRALIESAGAERTIVRFDARGLGLSDREVDDFSINARVLDIEAVVDCLGYETFDLGSIAFGVPAVVAYAVRHPERVSRLILTNAVARQSDMLRSTKFQALFDLLMRDWEMWTENVGSVVFGWGREEAREYGQFVRAAVAPETARHMYTVMANDDITELLPSVHAPTLLIHLSHLPYLSLDIARSLAARIPDARLIMPRGNIVEAGKEIQKAIGEFLSEDEEAAPAPLAAEDIHTILFTDVEGSTALTQRLGDAKARDLLREHERMVREALKAHGGSEVKTLGDGFMASFSSATKALECAIAMQRAFAEHNENADEPIKVRVGLNAGEPIAEEDDLFGTAVNEAARITATANGGEILVSNVVRELAKGKDFLFTDRGEANLKGFDEPVRLYEVRWREGE